jgi:glycosyltransferase involved in cell wall biosynthesis
MKSVEKVIYFSNPFYLDYDLPLIKNLAKETDIYYFLDVSPISTQATLLEIENYNKKPGIVDETTYNISKLFRDFLPEGKTFIINRKTNRPAISNLKLQITLAKIIKKISPDILHFNTDFNHNYFLIPFLCKILFVSTIHDPLPHLDNDSLRESLKRKIFFPFIRNFIILNNLQRNDFIHRYKLKKRNVFVSSMSTYDYLSTRTTISHLDQKFSPGHSIKIIFFGRINQYKGISYLLKAFNKIVTKYPETELILAGKGDLKKYYIEFSDNITLINRYILNDELSSLIVGSDFVVCPYIDATQSGVIMTAFAFAKPVIATDVGGLKEFVEDGITGFLINPVDADQLEIAMEKLITNPDLLSGMSKNIQNKYRYGDCSWENIAKETVKIYNKLR